MLIKLFRYLRGYLKIRITGYSPERFINLCKNKKIDIWGMESSHNSYEMYINVSNFRKLKPLLKKTHTRIEILERFGIPFFFHKYRKRKVFFTGVIICLSLMYAMTFFIWNIEVTGNQSITDEVLLEYLESIDISHGIGKHKINCEEIAKNIRKTFDEIIWVSASLDGTCLFINVKENDDTFDVSLTENEPCDIVSDKTGIVIDIITRNGVPKVSIGDEVKSGDILVSGSVELLNDAKEVASVHFVSSDADITLETTRRYEKRIEYEYQNKEYTGKERTQYYVKFDEHTFNIGILKNSFENYEDSTSEKKIKIYNNFYLPIYIGERILKEYTLEKSTYDKAQVESILNQDFENYCKKLEEEGATILEKNLNIVHDNSGATATCVLMLHESAGIRRKIVDF